MTASDRAAFAADAPLVRARLDAAVVAAERVLSGGVAWPAADLPDAVYAAAEGLATLGMPGGAGRLEALAHALTAVASAPDRPAREEASAVASDALHSALAWLRVARSEVDVVLLRASIAGDVPDAGARRRDTLTTTATPVGVERLGRRLCIHAVDADGPLLLIDELVDPDPIRPLELPVISRLFGDRIVLGRVLRGRVLVRDHPVSREGGHRVIRPSFVARPRLDPAPGGSPALPSVPLDGGTPVLGRLSTAHRMPVRLTVVDREPVLSSAVGVPLALVDAPPRATALAKLAVRGDTADLHAVVRRRGSELALLALDHPLDGRGFPDLDPGLYPLDATRLARRVPRGDLAGVWLTAALVRAGADIRMDRALDRATADDPVDAWRLTYARVALGRPAGVDGDLLRLALGAPAADDRWPLLDTSALAGLDAALTAEREALWRAHGAADLHHPSVGRVCARAVQLASFGEEEHGADGPARAAAFLEAHLAPRRDPGDDPDRWPSPLEWLWLARAAQGIGGAASIVGLRPDRVRLLHSVLAPVLRWVRHGDPQDVRAAGDALWCAASAGLLDRVVA